MAIINVRDRKLGSDDVAWGMGSYTYTDANGVVRTTPEINATKIPATATQSIFDELLDITAVADAGSLVAAVNELGTVNPATLYLRRGTYNLNADLTIPSNIQLWPENEAIIHMPNGKTLTVKGLIRAGGYQIFSWTGTGAFDFSECPMYKFPIEWLGGLTTSSDVAAVLEKYAESFGKARKAVELGCGVYNLTTAVVIDTPAVAGASSGNCLSIIGQSFNDSVLWVDVGAAVAISEGVDEDGGDPGVYIGDIVMKDFTFAGGAGACTTALKLAQCGNIDLDLNFWLGSTDFACIIGNCDWAIARLHLARGRTWPSAIAVGDLAEPAKGILLTNGDGASINGNNASEFYINGESVGTNPQLKVSPVYATGGASGETMEITGSFENWSGSPIIIDGKGAVSSVYQRAWIRFRNIHIENAATGGTIPISNITNVSFEGFENAVEDCPIELFNTKSVTFDNYFFRGGITISPDCQGTVLGPGVTEGPVLDYAPDTLYMDGPSRNQAYNAEPVGMVSDDTRNYIYNTQLNRWQSGIMDGGWSADANTVYTQETAQIHILPNCAKFVYTDTAPTHIGYTYYNLDSYQLQQFRGKYVSFSANVKLKSGDVYTTYPIFTISFVCPARANSTAYYLSQGVNDGAGNQYVCVAVTGNQLSGAAPPVWNTGDGALTIDGNVTWRCGMCFGNSNLGDNYNANVGSYYKLMTGCFCPLNVSSGSLVIAQYPQTSGAVGTLYLAEPALMIGRQSPRTYVETAVEFQNYIQIGALKIGADLVMPTSAGSIYSNVYHNVGDMVIGISTTPIIYRCTATGTPGGWTV